MAEPAYLRTTRKGYDAVAEHYFEMFRDSLAERPLERAVLRAFAELVARDGGGPVADLGCGPGHVTAHLRGLGLDAFGVDASAEMIALAREQYPEPRFERGSMAALDLADGSLAGALARWSIIHTPPRQVPALFGEFRRTLRPGARLLLGVSATDGPTPPTQSYDHTVATAYRWSPDYLSATLRASGFTELSRLVCEPEPDDPRQFREVLLLAQRD